MSFDVIPLPLAAPSSAITPLPEPARPTPQPRVSPHRAPPASVVPPAAVVTLAPALQPDQPSDLEEPRPAPRSTPRDISPLAAARTLVGEPSACVGGSDAAQIGGETKVDAGAEALLADGISGLTRDAPGLRGDAFEDLAQGLQGFALRPWDLVLRPLQHGRYRYRGVGFDAVIGLDGKVKYREKDGPHLAVGQHASENEDKAVEAAPAIGLGELGTWIEKIAGNDPHAAERRSFLERTRPLRELLRERAARGTQENALRRLESRLVRIAYGSANRLDKQRAIVALWDECAEDELGAEARVAVELFVRTQCPPEADCGFSASDLARLNERRVGSRRFEPYATGS